MKHAFVSLLVFCCSTAVLQAQDFCKPTSVFFDLNQSELKPAGKKTVDSLVKTLGGNEFILEIYGYTDTSNTDSYNRKLSQSRIDAVLTFLKSKQVNPKEIRTFNEGEDFNSSQMNKQAAFQRRVDVYLTPVEGDDVVFKNESGITVKRPVAAFGDCGICALKPRMTYLRTEEEANASGIDLVTDDGKRLITYGMALFDVDPCSSVPEAQREQFRTCMTLPAPKWANNVQLFELVDQPGNDSWRLLSDTLNYDAEQRTVNFCSRARKINCDAYVTILPGLKLVLPGITTEGKSFYKHVFSENAVERLRNDTIPFKSSVQEVISYFRVKNDWYLFKENAQLIQDQFLNRDSVSPEFCTVYVSDYALAASRGEIELKVRLKRYDKIGYYHPDYDLFVPLQRQGNHYHGQIYADGFGLCYIIKDRYYMEKNDAKNLKIKQKGGKSHAKVKQKYLFRKNKLSWRRVKRQVYT